MFSFSILLHNYSNWNYKFHMMVLPSWKDCIVTVLPIYSQIRKKYKVKDELRNSGTKHRSVQYDGRNTLFALRCGSVPWLPTCNLIYCIGILQPTDLYKELYPILGFLHKVKKRRRLLVRPGTSSWNTKITTTWWAIRVVCINVRLNHQQSIKPGTKQFSMPWNSRRDLLLLLSCWNYFRSVWFRDCWY
jgi:hypothetical protein